MSERTPNFRLIGPFTYSCGRYDTKTIEAGTFVRPIDLKYVPKHITDDERWKYFDKNTDVFCYYSGGIVPIPKALIREC